MLIVLIFIFGFFMGSMVEWFSYMIPKEDDDTITSKIKKCFKYAKKIANKRMIVSILIGTLNVIGWGDVEIFIVCGLLVGMYKLAIVAFISIVLCGGYGIYILIRKNSKKGLRVAFGPYIVFALMLVTIFVK